MNVGPTPIKLKVASKEAHLKTLESQHHSHGKTPVVDTREDDALFLKGDMNCKDQVNPRPGNLQPFSAIPM